MNKNKISISRLPAFALIIAIMFYAASCKPVIKSFKVTTHDTTEVRRVTADDTLKINYTVKGKPTLLIYQTPATDSANKILELKLVVEKGKKEVNRKVQVELVSQNSGTSITFSTELHGDSLIAAGDKNSGVWGDRFEIGAVTNASGRPLLVTHSGTTAPLDQRGVPSDAFAGTPVEGKWIFISLLTTAEKADHSLLPEQLQINTTIIHKRR